MPKPVIGIGSDVYRVPGANRERAFAYLTYVESLRKAGAVPILIPPQTENVDDLLQSLDGLLLAGGDDCDPAEYGEDRHPSVEPMDPRRQASEFSMARAAREKRLPTLGICLGSQVMNVAAGGTLIQDISSHHQDALQHSGPAYERARHLIHLEKGTRLASIIGDESPDVNSSHHQSVGKVGKGLLVNASAPDGIVEGVEDPQHPFYVGVQWHPEDMAGEKPAERLFEAFVAAAREYAESRRK